MLLNKSCSSHESVCSQMVHRNIQKSTMSVWINTTIPGWTDIKCSQIFNVTRVFNLSTHRIGMDWHNAKTDMTAKYQHVGTVIMSIL